MARVVLGRRRCQNCGAILKKGFVHCASCALFSSTERLIKSAEMGRIASHTHEAQANRSKTQRQHRAAKQEWLKSGQRNLITKEEYIENIQPGLKNVTLSVLQSTLGISVPYAVNIRAGRRIPHLRHWQVLAELVQLNLLSDDCL